MCIFGAMLQFRQIALVFLSAAVMVKSLIVPLICLDYEFRKDFIIKNYCINKNRPELHCDGKCFLARKINAENQKEEQNALGSFIEKLIEINSVGTPGTFVFDNEVEIIPAAVQNYFVSIQATVDFSSAVFHPPVV